MKHDTIAVIMLCVELFLIILSLYVLINDEYPISENECARYCNSMCGETVFVELKEKIDCSCICNDNV